MKYMNIFTWKLYAANATHCDKRVQIVVSESAWEMAGSQGTIERFQGEDKLCLSNKSEVLADNIGLSKASKTENDIFEFDWWVSVYGRLPSESRVV